MSNIITKSNFANANYCIVTFEPEQTVNAAALQDGEEARPIEGNKNRPLFFQGFTRPPCPPEAPEHVRRTWATTFATAVIIWTNNFADLLPGSGFFNEHDAQNWFKLVNESTPCILMTKQKAKEL
jgi:hypothetical protein